MKSTSGQLGIIWGFVILQSIVMMLASYGFFVTLPYRTTALQIPVFALQAMSNFGIHLVLAALAIWLWSSRFRGTLFLAATISTILSIAILIDWGIYGVFRYHFNGLVLWVLSSEAGRATLGLPPWFPFGAIVVVVFWFAFSYGMIGRIGRVRSIRLPITLKQGLIAVLCLVSLDKSIYALQDLRERTFELRTSEALPWYWTVTIKKTYAKLFGEDALAFEAPRRSSFDDSPFPTAEQFTYEEDAPRFNILVIAIDSWRFDALSSENMPNLMSHVDSFSRFDRHFSGGNGTRDGIFSMFYGLHSAHWDAILKSQHPSILIDALMRQQYEMKIRSSTSLQFPEFRRTAFAGVPDESFMDQIKIRFQSHKDGAQIDDLIKVYSAENSRPRFDFLFLDAAHSPYSFPDETAAFKPFAETYVSLSVFDSEQVHLLRNSYKNALRYMDGHFARLLPVLKQPEIWDNTIIIITGDHGEEFFDNGYWGHTSAFTPAQIHVPLLVHIPKTSPALFTRRTRHIDLPATILESIGLQTESKQYSLGENLFKGTGDRDVVSCGWDQCAAFDGQHYLIFGTAAYNPATMRLYNDKYEELPTSMSNIPANLLQLALTIFEQPKTNREIN